MNENILLFSKNANKLEYELHSAIDNSSPMILRSVREHKNTGATSNIHENIEIFAFFGGRGRVRCNTDFYDLAAGDTVIVNSYVEHQLVFTEAPVACCIIVDAGFCKMNGIDVRRLRFTPFIRDGVTTELARSVYDAFKSNTRFRDTAIKCSLLNLLLHLCENWSQTREETLSSGNRSFEYVCMAVDFIKHNFNKKINIDQIAGEVGLSKYHFSREFKRITGHTVVDYIRIIRCEYAAELLKSGKYSVKEVAVRCGYDDVSYFTKTFKKTTSRLPSQF